ncbi:hypothetical protein CNYM01_13374 [Colletotrichum nymphaeae SA-01]|uniref:Uncharacterized protein n=1 Tax=Colletotrichum nymphaeae SA-01 TaxID=1460502 RepID=A0A135UXX9_9PEZI|nr:hypothetical protein CNYM01_13374 [Colletotrichum nymphaeae SA-01]
MVSFIPSALLWPSEVTKCRESCRTSPLYFPTIEGELKNSNNGEETQMIHGKERNANIVKSNYEVSVVPRFSGLKLPATRRVSRWQRKDT